MNVLENAIFFFGSKRIWLFPSTPHDYDESRRQMTDYLSFDPEFLKLIKAKEHQGTVYWLKPECDYKKVSNFLTSLKDPVTGNNYKPLILDPNWWRTEFTLDKGYYIKSGIRVVNNFLQGEHDYEPVLELLYQSNKNMLPVLQLTDEELKQLQDSSNT